MSETKFSVGADAVVEIRRGVGGGCFGCVGGCGRWAAVMAAAFYGSVGRGKVE